MNKNITSLLLTSILALGLSGCVIGNRIGQYGHDVHTSAGNISVDDNDYAGALKATNGNIDIGHHAMAKSVKVVNGNITIDDFSRAVSLQTTNGNINAGENVLVSGNVITMNGNIRIEQQAEIGADVITSTGDIFIGQGTTVKGDIIFENPGYWSSHFEQEIPTLEVAKEVTINGQIHLYRPIELLLDQSIDPKIIIRHYDDRE